MATPLKHLVVAVSLGIAAAMLSTAAQARPSSNGTTTIPLYPAGTVPSLDAPEVAKTLPTGETLIFNVSEPTLEVFRPAAREANGTTVIVAPGGGFVALDYNAGGTDVARQLARRGFTALVLKYRTIRSAADPEVLPEVHMREMESLMERAKTGLPLQASPFAGEQHAVEDGRRAVAIVRQHANEWGVDPKRVGVLGFSAGGFLAVDLAIGPPESRPDFVGLIYGGLRTPVPADAPPAFIAAAADDDYQPNDAALLFDAWRKAGAPAELHIYEHGGHGFTLKPKGTSSDHWFDDLIAWMESRGLAGLSAKAPH